MNFISTLKSSLVQEEDVSHDITALPLPKPAAMTSMRFLGETTRRIYNRRNEEEHLETAEKIDDHQGISTWEFSQIMKKIRGSSPANATDDVKISQIFEGKESFFQQYSRKAAEGAQKPIFALNDSEPSLQRVALHKWDDETDNWNKKASVKVPQSKYKYNEGATAKTNTLLSFTEEQEKMVEISTSNIDFNQSLDLESEMERLRNVLNDSFVSSVATSTVVSAENTTIATTSSALHSSKGTNTSHKNTSDQQAVDSRLTSRESLHLSKLNFDTPTAERRMSQENSTSYDKSILQDSDRSINTYLITLNDVSTDERKQRRNSLASKVKTFVLTIEEEDYDSDLDKKTKGESGCRGRKRTIKCYETSDDHNEEVGDNSVLMQDSMTTFNECSS